MDAISKILDKKLQAINPGLELNTGFRYMRLMALIYMTLLLASTVCAYKIVEIGLLPEPGSTLIYTFSFFWGNIYMELYGAKSAKNLIWESVVCGYIFAILVAMVNWLPAPAYWNHQASYEQVLGHVLRFTTAGTIGYLLVYLEMLLRYLFTN